MNFYAAQEEARRASRRLILLFTLSVITLIVAADLLLVGLMYLGEAPGAGFWRYAAAIDWQFHAAIAGVISLIIAAGSLYKYLYVSAGGSRVAESVGATRVPPDAQEPARRRLLNIVEEMAIASGTPVPSVYVLEREPGVNAFAAGLGIDDAVVCVTQGCLELLNREQLQGVVAHEFSHILNGDMRLNLRVIGILHGILLLGLLGEGILRGLGRRRFVAGGGRGRDGAAGLMMAGIGLVVLGYGGTFFGRLIKASVNRQREFLADASAVQFTRNPNGIAGALKVIGGHVHGSGVEHPSAPAISHMLLASGRRRLAAREFAGFATHPPLDQRIRRLDPSWDGRWPAVEAPARAEPETAHAPRESRIEQAAAVLTTAAVLGSLPQPGAISRDHVDYARLLLDELPEPVTDAAHEPWGARALVYALLLDEDDAIRAAQLAALGRREDDRVVELAGKLHAQTRRLGRELHLPVVDLALPALRELSPAQAQLFRSLLTTLVRIDRHVSPFEWAVTTVIANTLAAAEDRAHLDGPHNRQVGQLRIQVRVILSVLAHAGHDGDEEVRKAFAAGAAFLGLAGEQIYALNALKFDTVDNALRRLDRLQPREKERLLLACLHVAEANHDISVAEIEMIRAFGAALHCPVPPVLGAGAILAQRPAANP
jgi:Zn-dependent protease with chaperone function